jgi:pyrimidine operon attenuation protein/uracil phosphoribosyltransferase
VPETAFEDRESIRRMVRAMAATLVDEALAGGAASLDALALVGVRRGGVPVARMLAEELESLEGVELPVGTLDITLYRDDAAVALPNPRIGPSVIPFEVGGRDLVLVDDVLMTGRTVRAAIENLLDYGRPRRIWLAVLFDRGGRELPIAADFVGREVEVDEELRLEVDLTDDGAIAGAVLRGLP